MPNDKGTAVATFQAPSLVAKFANRYSVDAGKILGTLKATCFKGEVSNEQMMALLIVADQYKLNPFTRELYAFPEKGGGIVPVVGVDGWARIINEHQQFDGLQFGEHEDGTWCECTIYRKDRAHPTTVREYFSEVKRDTGPWKSHPRRMLRHKAMIQCARLAFGYAGIYDPDEAERIVEGERIDLPGKTTVDRIKSAVKAREIINCEATQENPDPGIDPRAYSYAELADKINAIGPQTTGGDLQLLDDLIRSHKDEAQRGELEALKAAKLKELATAAVKK